MYKRVFGRLVIAGFLKSLTLSVTGMIDCAIVGRYLGADGLSAMKLAMPVFSVISLFSAILSTGVSVSVSRDVTRGKTERAGITFQTVFTISVLIAAAGMLVGIACPFVITDLLAGPDVDPEIFAAATEYISPILIAALPIILFDVLGSLAMVEGAMKHIRCASAALLITDIIADLIAVHMDAGMTGIAAASGAAYFCACLVITLFFLGKRSMFRIQFCRPDTDSLRQVVLFGLPMLIKELSGIIWPLSVNRLMMRYGTVTGLAALSIQDAVHYIPAALCSGIASATLVISGIFAGEHDKQGLRGLNTSILRWSLIGGTSVALALGIVSRPMMFLFTEDPKVLSLSISALRLYLIGVPFLALNYAVVSYLQGLGKHRTSGTVLFLNHILLSVSSAFILAVLFRTEGIFASYGVCEMVMTLLIAASLFIFFKVRKKTIFSGADRDDPELRRKIRSVEDAVNASADVNQFCTDNGIAGREAHLISLCTEELAVNSIKHGFQDQKQHHLDLRVVESENSLLLRLRDDCRRFDLVEWHRMMNPDDPAINIGLRIVFAEADDVNYSSALSLNNVCVRCFTERKEPDGDQTPAGT